MARKKVPARKNALARKNVASATRKKSIRKKSVLKATPRAVAVAGSQTIARVDYNWLDGRIHEVRSLKVMLDSDLAELYNVDTRTLVQAVKRNIDRFPADFMFQLTTQEAAHLTSQSVISSSTHGGRRHLPYAFTEQGIAMLSSVLRSKRAIQANIYVMRAFVSMRRALATQGELTARVEKIERTQESHSSYIGLLAEEIEQLRLPPPEPPKRRIGYPTKAAHAKAGR